MGLGSLINIFGEVLEVKLFSSDLGVKTENVIGLVLEMRGGIEAVGDEEAVVREGGGDVALGDSDELLLDLAKHVQRHLDLLLRVVALNGCAHNGHIVVLLADAVH